MTAFILGTMHPLPGQPVRGVRWFLVGALPGGARVAHLMTRGDDPRYGESRCGEERSKMWDPVDVSAEADVVVCQACAETLSAAGSSRNQACRATGRRDRTGETGGRSQPASQIALNLPLS